MSSSLTSMCDSSKRLLIALERGSSLLRLRCAARCSFVGRLSAQVVRGIWQMGLPSRLKNMNQKRKGRERPGKKGTSRKGSSKANVRHLEPLAPHCAAHFCPFLGLALKAWDFVSCRACFDVRWWRVLLFTIFAKSGMRKRERTRTHEKHQKIRERVLQPSLAQSCFQLASHSVCFWWSYADAFDASQGWGKAHVWSRRLGEKPTSL